MKHIIITGASRGIGLETARFLLDQNCAITAVARSEAELSQLEKYRPGKAFTLCVDITKKDASARLREHLSGQGLKIDGFIHNAGLLINKPFEKLTDQDWQQQIDVNLMAPVKLTRDNLDFFKSGSHNLCIGSMGGFQGSSKFYGLSAYSVSKGALTILSECLSVELESRKISCNCLCLGAVQTEMLQQAFPGFKAPVAPDEMGTFIGDFILNGHRFYNGQVLPVALNSPG